MSTPQPPEKSQIPNKDALFRAQNSWHDHPDHPRTIKAHPQKGEVFHLICQQLPLSPME
jgi:hypothetical protein